jgi:hypothetical protein
LSKPSVADLVRQALAAIGVEGADDVPPMADDWFRIIATIDDLEDREKAVRVVGAALALQAARSAVRRADADDERLKQSIMGALRVGLLFL